MGNATTNRERGIVFTGDAVRATLTERKTQTRHVLKTKDGDDIHPNIWKFEPVLKRGELLWQGFERDSDRNMPRGKALVCPYGNVGDRLWVRETWAISGMSRDGERYEYKAAPADGDYRTVSIWRSPTNMPRRASRILLEITDLRVEQLQEISGDDAIREGILPSDQWTMQRVALHRPNTLLHEQYAEAALRLFPAHWDAVNMKRGYGWNMNPWVWVITFKRIDGAVGDANG